MSTVNPITDADLEGKGVTPLNDTPEMSSADLKRKFEEILRDVAIPKINEIIDLIYNNLPLASSEKTGGVLADPAESSDVQPVRLGDDGKFYTAAGSGGEYHVDDEISETSRYPVQNKIINAALNVLRESISAQGEDIAENAEAIASAESMIAPAWNAADTYYPGDCRRDEGKLWKAKRQNTDIKPTEGEDWTQINVEDDSSRMVVLWENASPTSSFSPQTISLDLSRYTHVGVMYTAIGSTAFAGSTKWILIKNVLGHKGSMSFPYWKNGYREAVISSDGLQFTAANLFENYGSQSTQANNELCIPYIIYGILG